MTALAIVHDEESYIVEQIQTIIIENPVAYERQLAKKAMEFATAHGNLTKELIRILYQVEYHELWQTDPNRYISLRDWADQNISPYLENSTVKSIPSWCGVATMLVGISYEQSPEIADEIVEKTPVQALKALRNKQMKASPEEKEMITKAMLSGERATKIIADVKTILNEPGPVKTAVYAKLNKDGDWVLSGVISMMDLVKLTNSGIFDVRMDGD